MDESGAANRSGQSAADEVRFDGLIMANVSTFTMTPDRRIVSAIFDDFVLVRLPSAAGQEAEELDHMRRMVIAIPPAARGRKVGAQLRGYWHAGGSDAAPVVTLRLGDATHPATLPAGEGDIWLDVEATTAPGEDALLVEIEARLPPPATADGEVHLSIDSIDLSLLD
jgi:hypothetical protein